jgi:hypothetical protein
MGLSPVALYSGRTIAERGIDCYRRGSPASAFYVKLTTTKQQPSTSKAGRRMLPMRRQSRPALPTLPTSASPAVYVTKRIYSSPPPPRSPETPAAQPNATLNSSHCCPALQRGYTLQSQSSPSEAESQQSSLSGAEFQQFAQFAQSASRLTPHSRENRLTASVCASLHDRYSFKQRPSALARPPAAR